MEFVKVERNGIERRSGFYKIVNRNTGDTLLAFSKGDMKLQVATKIAPSLIDRRFETWPFARDWKGHEKDFDFYVCYMDDTKENFRSLFNRLKEEEHPSYNYYGKAEEDEIPPEKPSFTVSENQFGQLKRNMDGIVGFFSSNMPDYLYHYEFLLALIEYPHIGSISHFERFVGAWFVQGNGLTQSEANGLVHLTKGRALGWNKGKTTSFQGFGKEPLLSCIVNLMNNRDLIEYGDRDELRQMFREMLGKLWDMGERQYPVIFDRSLEIPEDVVFEVKEGSEWRVQFRKKNDRKEGLIICDGNPNSTYRSEWRNEPVLDPVERNNGSVFSASV